MLNWMTRIVVPATHLPPDDVGGDPQGLRQDLDESHILPNDDDIEAIKSRLAQRVTKVLGSNFKVIENLHDSAHPQAKRVEKSTFTPLEVLNLDEANDSDNIQILLQFAKNWSVGNSGHGLAAVKQLTTRTDATILNLLREADILARVCHMEWTLHGLLQKGRGRCDEISRGNVESQLDVTFGNGPHSDHQEAPVTGGQEEPAGEHQAPELPRPAAGAACEENEAIRRRMYKNFCSMISNL
ncbi:Hypp6832 [Branchiostoma lanceolatum]|uniref:Hypp6832 protein n=1 Tax=Branchiostoma lanceolatum TaxID=7740 RepID=A0A8J9YVR1_BRALA|nr:Hypp6832 [Branchiostoma lanceolatum]